MKSKACVAGLLVLLAGRQACAQIPEGFEVVQSTQEPQFYDGVPRMNNCGTVVFATRLGDSWADADVFAYDNGRTTRVTSNGDRDVGPDIGDNEAIIWGRGVGEGAARELIRLRGGVEEVISDDRSESSGRSMNNIGGVVWNDWPILGCRDSDADIMYFDDDTTRRITFGGASNQGPQLNDHGQIVWTRRNFCVDPWESDIMMYADGVVMQLTDGQLEPNVPHLNNGGQVVWGGPEGIELWEDGITRQITDWGRNPRINERGDIGFIRWHEDLDTWHAWLYLEGTFHQLSSDTIWNVVGDINDFGEVVWHAGLFPINDVYFMRRIRTGDSEFDGDIDHDDLAKLVDCMTGPMWVERTNPGPEDSLCECRFLDINHDGSVDLRDYALFQENFAGKP